MHGEVDPAREEIHLICLPAKVSQELLFIADASSATVSANRNRTLDTVAASAATSFDNFENGLSLGLDLKGVWIVHESRV